MKIRNILFAVGIFSLGGIALSQNQTSSFVAATFNVRCPVDQSPNSWEERLPRCKAIIQKNGVDIMGLQEPYIEQIEGLVKDSEYEYIGGGRNDFKQKGEFSCILYKKSRFTCLKSGTFGLSEQPDVPGIRSWNSACPRIATWGIFLDKQTGKEFVYYNTHLDHISELARCEGIKLLVAHAKTNAVGKPIMLSGDFNTKPGTATYQTAQEYLRDSRAVSATPHTGPNKTFHGWGKNNRDYPIDYIFVSSEFQVLSHRTDDTLFDGQYPSDHYPVIVTLSLLLTQQRQAQ